MHAWNNNECISFQNGFLSALPYICMWVSSFFFGWLADKLINSGRFPLSHVRKMSNVVGSFMPALGLVWLAFVGCDRVLAIVILCLSLTFNAAFYSGVMVRT